MKRIIQSWSVAAVILVGIAGPAAASDGMLVPDMDPSRAASAVSLLLGVALVLSHRRKLAAAA